MKFASLILLSLIARPTFAENPICEDKPTAPASAKDILKATSTLILDEAGCEPLDEQQKSKKDFAEFIKKNAGGDTVVLSRDNPDKRTANSVTYKFPNKALKPGEAIYLWIPSDLSKRGVDFVVLGHRQNPETETGTTPGDKWDKVPGLTSVQVYDDTRGAKSGWRYWGGMSSGSEGAKFAEVGPNLEMEGLYEWSQQGHTGVKTGDTAHDDIHPKFVKIVSKGKDTVEIGELTLKTTMSESDSSQEKVFTKGIVFGSQKTGNGYELGAGQKTQGIFEDSIPLRRGRNIDYDTSKLPPGWKIDKGNLIVPLQKGKILTNIELAAGDSHPDKISNEDGGYGTKGWSRLTVLKKSGNETDVMMDGENVPPEGFLKAAPTKCGRPVGDGEYLVIQAERDTTYLAGLKLNYRNP